MASLLKILVWALTEPGAVLILILYWIYREGRYVLLIVPMNIGQGKERYHVPH